MTARNVTKQLATMEDLAQGAGAVSQIRGEVEYELGRVDQPYAVNDTASMQALDVTLYTRARVYKSTSQYTDYVYDATATSGITSTGTGFWVKNTHDDIHLTSQPITLTDENTSVVLPATEVEPIDLGNVYTGQFLKVSVNGTETSEYTVTGDYEITLNDGVFSAGDTLVAEQNGSDSGRLGLDRVFSVSGVGAFSGQSSLFLAGDVVATTYRDFVGDGGGGTYDIVDTASTDGATILSVGSLFAVLRIGDDNIAQQSGIKDDSADYSAQFEAIAARYLNNEISWSVRAKINRADFGLYLNIKFTGDGEIYTDLVTTTDGSGNITFAGSSLISTTATSVNIKMAKHNGTNPGDSALLVFCESDDLAYINVVGSQYVDSGHWLKGGIDCECWEFQNNFKTSNYSGAVSQREGAVAFSKISVGSENYGLEDEPRYRGGRLFSNNNNFDVWCSDGSNKDLAKYTGLCQAPQITGNLYHNRNIDAEAEVDTYTAGYRAKYDNDHVNCSVKIQTILGALSGETSSSPISHFSRVGGSFKFEDGFANLFGILCRGGYFLVDNYVIDAKQTTAQHDFNAIHVRSSDATYFDDDSGTGSCVNYRVGSGLIDIRCDDYNGQTISPFNEFTGRLHYDYDGVTVLGGNSIVANGINPGSLSNVKIYHADNYPALAITGLELYSQNNLLLNTDGTIISAAFQSERQKGNFGDSVASSVNPGSLGGTLDADSVASDIDLAGTGSISVITGGYRGGEISMRFVSGSTTLVHDISEISLAGGANKIINAAGQMITLKKLSSNGIWYEVGGTV